ncbi:MAG: DUF4340 domain-containing protein, partial [Gemmataceae bacterium]|nr:DUF4340 domain-containing protein [Gemmataceae bacterium]
AKAPEAGVKGLLNAIRNLRVDSEADFVAPAKGQLAQHRLEDGKEDLRIQVQTTDANNERAKQTLLVGEVERGYYYARLANDDGVFKLPEKQLTTVLSALAKPGTLRSLDVGHFDPKTVDVLTIRTGKEQLKAWHHEGQPWQLQIGAEQPAKANENAVAKLLETLQGKRQILEFKDAATDAEAKKLDADLGLDAPVAEISLYSAGLEKKGEAKKDDAKDQKDDKKEGKKEEKKDDKKEPRGEEAFTLKKEAKPLLLKFGKVDKDSVAVLRTSGDGLTSRFLVPKSMYEAVAPPEGALAFLDLALPRFDQADVTRVTLQHGSKVVELARGVGDHAGRWMVRESQKVGDENLADAAKTEIIWQRVGNLTAKKWIKKLDPKDDLDQFGLKNPSLVVTVKATRLTPTAAATVVAAGGDVLAPRAALTVALLAMGLHADRSPPIVLALGKETADKDHYARHSGSELLFTVPADLFRTLRELDLRDRSALRNFEAAYIGAGVVLASAAQSLQGLAVAAVAAQTEHGADMVRPLGPASVVDLDPKTVAAVRIAVRDKYELREFHFQRKEKEWSDASGLKDFALDGDKVEKVVKEFASLRPERMIAFAGGPRGDQKLSAKDFFVTIELTTEGGKSVVYTVGAPLDTFGYFLHVSQRPGAVYLIAPAKVAYLERGVAYFAKERIAE